MSDRAMWQEKQKLRKERETKYSQYAFFWKTSEDPYGCFSQWYPSPFEENGILFPTAEHYMMYGKAMLFGDSEVGAQILAEADPREVKALGRRVRNFDDAKWNAERLAIVIRGNRAKFSTHDDIRQVLLSTTGMIVEASPMDRVWGIGLGEKKARQLEESAWRGQNLLGKALMAVRAEFQTKTLGKTIGTEY